MNKPRSFFWLRHQGGLLVGKPFKQTTVVSRTVYQINVDLFLLSQAETKGWATGNKDSEGSGPCGTAETELIRSDGQVSSTSCPN